MKSGDVYQDDRDKPKCQKVTYKSYEKAWEEALHRHRKNGVVLWVYRCEVCGKFHHTSQAAYKKIVRAMMKIRDLGQSRDHLREQLQTAKTMLKYLQKPLLPQDDLPRSNRSGVGRMLIKCLHALFNVRRCG